MSMPAVGRILPADAKGAVGAPPACHSGFTVATDISAPVAAKPGTISPTGKTAPVSTSLMLALQETMTSEAGDREARQHGQKLLAALAELQRALLSDGGGEALGKLLLLTTAMPETGNPELARTINSIRLRARIELARASMMKEGTPSPTP